MTTFHNDNLKEQMKNKIWIHYGSKLEYTIEHFCKIKNYKNLWVDGIVYKQKDSDEVYCRTKKNFYERFKMIGN